MTDRINTESEIIDVEDLETDFLNLRIGEEIPRLKIKQIRKVINRTKQDNLTGVDYKFIIETRDKKLLMVNSWVLWKKISSVLRKAGRIDVDLELRHSGLEDYSIKLL
jgi:hypothetical protein